MRLGVDEILQMANEAKSKDEKVKVLQDNFSSILVDVIRLAFDQPKYNWRLTGKEYPYRKNRALDQHAALFQTLKQVPRYFLDPPIQFIENEEKVRQLWINFLEMLEPGDAELMESIRRGKWPYKTITKAIVTAAFGEYLKKEDADIHPAE